MCLTSLRLSAQKWILVYTAIVQLFSLRPYSYIDSLFTFASFVCTRAHYRGLCHAAAPAIIRCAPSTIPICKYDAIGGRPQQNYWYAVSTTAVNTTRRIVVERAASDVLFSNILRDFHLLFTFILLFILRSRDKVEVYWWNVKHSITVSNCSRDIVPRYTFAVIAVVTYAYNRLMWYLVDYHCRVRSFHKTQCAVLWFGEIKMYIKFTIVRE